MIRRLTGVALALSGVALALGAMPAGAAAPAPSPVAAAARLQGFWSAAGVITRAVNVPGEARGQRVTRVWAFVPDCPSGPCTAVKLVRQRATGYDTLVLHLTRPGTYVGRNAFYAPVGCQGRLYPTGIKVPFTITVTVTNGAAQPDGSVLATSFTASYVNLNRINLTRCYLAPTAEAALYAAAPAAPGAPPAPGAAPAIRRVRRTPSSSGS